MGYQEIDNSMMKAGDLAIKLRELADKLDTLPDTEINMSMGVVAVVEDQARIIFPTQSALFDGTGTIQ